MGHREYRVYAPWAGTPHQAGATYEAIYEYADREEITLGETIERAIVSLNGGRYAVGGVGSDGRVGLSSDGRWEKDVWEGSPLPQAPRAK